MKKIRVLHIIKNLELGGAEVNLYNLVKAFDSEMLETHVAYSSGGAIEERFRAAGIRLFCYSAGSHRVKSLATFGIVARLALYIVRQRIQIVHTHNFSAHAWGGWSAKLTGRKIIEHVHDFRYMDPEEFKRRRGSTRQYEAIRYFKNFSDRVVVLTKQDRDRIIEKGWYPREKVVEILNGIPLSQEPNKGAPRTRAALGLPQDASVIFMAARIASEKNIELVLEFAPRVFQEVPGAYFLIAGQGPLLEAFEKSIRDRKLSERVRFMGFCPDIDALLGLSDVFILPSFLELHSIALLEALNCGVPVVISRGVGCHDEFIVEGVNGFLADPFCSEGWVQAVTRLLKDAVLRRRVGEEGRRLCRERFNINHVTKKFEDLYKELIAS